MDQFFFRISIMLVPALFAVTLHEVSHGFVADRFGDSTARRAGRLTLNPLKHLDIFGTLMVFIVGIGWAKPVPVDFRNLRNPRRDMILVAASGPVTNFLVAALSAFCLRAVVALGQHLGPTPLFKTVLEPTILMLAFSVYINLLLGLFNLIPLPPLDGGRVAVGILPERLALPLARLEPYGMIIIIALVFFTNVFSSIIWPLLNRGVILLAGPASEIVFGVTKLLMR